MRKRENIKTFDEYWEEVKSLGLLPNTAVLQIPEALRFQTKMKLIEMPPQETVQIILKAVDMVNDGSTKRLDILVKEQIETRKK